jgi:hypothetical protein
VRVQQDLVEPLVERCRYVTHFSTYHHLVQTHFSTFSTTNVSIENVIHGLVFDSKLFLTRDIMSAEWLPANLKPPPPKPPAAAAPKPKVGPGGKVQQDFAVVYHRKKGFSTQSLDNP